MNYKIAVCITFFYKQNRVKYLLEVIDGLVEFSVPIDLTIISNNLPIDFASFLKNYVFKKFNFILNIFSPVGLGHPYLLAWSHYSVFKEKILDISFSHFIYLEDDIKFTENNFKYWVEARNILKNDNLIPAFFRYEINTNSKWYSTDVLKSMSIYDCKVILNINNDHFINIVYPYQGMYLYDRELMLEYFHSSSFNPDFDHGIYNSIFPLKPFNIREKAALGLTFFNIPKTFRSRTVLPYDVNKNQLKTDCLIHHIPNNYTLDQSSLNGRIEVDKIFKNISFKLYLSNLTKESLKRLVRFIIKK